MGQAPSRGAARILGLRTAESGVRTVQYSNTEELRTLGARECPAQTPAGQEQEWQDLLSSMADSLHLPLISGRRLKISLRWEVKLRGDFSTRR